MGLFDLFKKKTNQTEQANLSLELLLQKAANEPAYRAEFYKRLLSDKLVIITQNTGLQEGSRVLQENTNVNIFINPDGKIPVFTSTERIFDKGIIKEQVQYMQMKGQDLFVMTRGATLLLNPNSDYGKVLLPDEVEKLLNGEILTANLKTLIIKKSTEVQIGQPSTYPTKIVNALKVLFAAKPNVEAAYLGWIYDRDSGEPPHYIFGLEADGDVQSLTQEAGFTAEHFLAKNEFVDFIRIDNKGAFSDYFLKQTKPFYKR